MNFTDDHIEIMEEHKPLWEGLRDIGIIRNLDKPLLEKLQGVYNEAVGPEIFTLWCKECVADMIRLLYTNYETWSASNAPAAEEGSDSGRKPGKGKKGNKSGDDGN